MNSDNHQQHALYEALHDLKRLQDLLASSWSKYYGHLFSKWVGSDTIPCCFTTKECKLLTVVNPKTHTETSYFRMDAIHKRQITLTLLRAFDLDDVDTNAMKDMVRLEKTDAQLTIDSCSLLAIQLLAPALLGDEFYVESKW